MKKSKKGSSLVLVLVFFSVLSILGMAMISLAISNYKVKILKGNIKANMYASESGIDEAYGIIGRIVDEAILKGNNAVKDYMDQLDLNNQIEKKKTFLNAKSEKDRMQNEINDLDLTEDKIKALQDQISNIDAFISNSENDSEYVKNDLSIDIEKIKSEQNAMFKENYKSYITNKLSLIDESENNKNNLIAAFESKYILKMPENQKSVVYVENFDSNISFNNSILTINLKSIYRNNNIEKIIKADYDIDTPDYEGSFCIENNSKEINENIVWTKAICADGNMDIKDSGKVDINGSIYIKGDTSNDGGINIVNPRFNITGDVSTARDVKLASASNNTSIGGNIYAKNIILTETANASKLTLNGSAYTTDDLELNSTEKGVIDIDGDFYGLEAGLNSTTSDASSSIIINSDDLGLENGSSLRIGGESIIMGTSYIKTSPLEYQTGESLSIKGNYRAYMEPLTDIDETERLNKGKQSLKEDNIIFDEENYEPFTPPDKFISNNSQLNVFDKSDYIKYYIEQKKKSGEAYDLITEGVNIDLTKSYHTGAIVGKDGQLAISKTELDIIEALNKKKYQYNKMVYFMGADLQSGNESEENIKAANSPVIYVSNQLNLSEISSDTNLENDKYMIKTGNCALIFPKGNVTMIPSQVPEGNKITLNNSKYEGVIIANGDLYICGEMNFNGTIICTGSIHIIDDENKSITYNEEIVKKVIATNYNTFKNVFKNSGDKTNVVIDAKISDVGNNASSVSSNKVIKLKNWTLVK